jgi:hypothetical protein
MAIAFDAATDGGTATGTSLTFSHTCGAGSDRLLLVGINGDLVGVNDDITGVTYAGVSMTLVAKITATTARYQYLYYLLNPATGANNVVISCTNSHFLGATSASYTGVSQSGQPDNSVTNTGVTVTQITGTLTTVADNCWTMALGCQNFSGNTMSAGTNTTERVELGTFFTAGMYDRNAAITPAGSTSLTVANSGTSTMGIIMASFSPAGAAAGATWPGYTGPFGWR